MSNLASPILVFGDLFVSKDKIKNLKQKHLDTNWITMSASKDSLDDIRMEAGLESWDDSTKAIIINDLPNRKQARDFLLDLSATCPETTKIIIWDSTNAIKVDPKTKTFGKTWGDFIKSFKKIDGNKVYNNGNALTEKEETSCVAYVQKCFKKLGKEIHEREARLVISIVGYDRGLLKSDVEKMSITAPSPVTARFILENAFPTSKEAVLYKLGNALNNADYLQASDIIDEFLESGVNPNPIAELFVRQARWQMVACYYWCHGMQWGNVIDRMMEMGKFPSYVWHSSKLSKPEKKAWGDKFAGDNGMLDFLVREKKIPAKFFKIKKEVEPEKKTKAKKGKVKAKAKTKAKTPRGECIPMRFMAQQTVDFVHSKVIKPNASLMTHEELVKKAVDRAMKVYLFTHEKYCAIRYGEDPVQDLKEMARMMTSTSLEGF